MGKRKRRTRPHPFPHPRPEDLAHLFRGRAPIRRKPEFTERDLLDLRRETEEILRELDRRDPPPSPLLAIWWFDAAA